MWCCTWGRGPRGNNAACLALGLLSVTSPATHKQIGPFWCWFLGGRVFVCSRTLWVSPMNSPVRLGVSPTTATPPGFYSQRFWGFIFPHWNPGLCGLSHSPVVPPGLSTWKCGTTQSASCQLAHPVLQPYFAECPLCPGCLFPPILPVLMNVSSLTPWLLDFHTVWFSGSSYYFLFWNLLLSFFWLYGEESVSTYASILARSETL